MQGLHLNPEEQLIELILSISEHERESEILRQKIAENVNTEPYALFLRFTVNKREAINAHMMKAFLDSNGHNVAEDLCQHVINHYGPNKEGELEFREFLALILPRLDSRLRATTVLKDNFRPGDRLDDDTEDLMSNLLLKEMNILTDIEPKKCLLFQNSSISEERAFNMLATPMQEIQYSSILNFCKKHNVHPFEEQIVHFISRIDQNDDGVLSIDEFVQGMRPLGLKGLEETQPEISASFLRERLSLAKSTPVKPAKQDRAQELQSTIQSTNAKAERMNPDEESKTNPRPTVDEYLRKRELDQHESEVRRKLFGVESETRERVSYSREQPRREPLTFTQDELLLSSTGVPRIRSAREFAVIMRRLISTHKSTEALKQDLAVRADMNCYDVFHYFDEEGKGYVYLSQLERKLNDLGIYTGKDDAFLLMRKYDHDSDGRLRFSDFSEMIAPNSIEYTKLLNNRLPINADDNFSIEELLTSGTLALLKRLLKKLIADENSCEEERVFFTKFFSVYDIFNQIDVNRDGYVDVTELREFLLENDVYVTQRELYALVDRFDYDEDGKISYSDFLHEMSPKL